MKNSAPVFAALASLLAISACVAPKPPPAPRPEPRAAPQPAPPTVQAASPVGDWRDWPITPGDWVYRDDQRGSIALFGAPGEGARFLIRCDASRRSIFLSRAGQSSAPVTMTLRATAGLKQYTAGNAGGTPPYLATELQANDDMLDKIAFSRGRFIVETDGTTPLAIPIYPEFTRVVEDCRK